MKLLKRICIVALLALVYFIPSPSLTHAQTSSWLNTVCVAEGDVATIQGTECLFNNVISIALRLLGIAMFIMLIVGGFKYLTAGGDPKAVEAAKGTLTMAIGGLVLAILSWFILVLIEKFTGTTLTTNFTIMISPTP